MTYAPLPSRRPLRWNQPAPLRPAQNVEAGDLRRSELQQQQLKIQEPSVEIKALDGVSQRELTGAARYMLRDPAAATERVRIRQSGASRGTRVLVAVKPLKEELLAAIQSWQSDLDARSRVRLSSLRALGNSLRPAAHRGGLECCRLVEPLAFLIDMSNTEQRTPPEHRREVCGRSLRLALLFKSMRIWRWDTNSDCSLVLRRGAAGLIHVRGRSLSDAEGAQMDVLEAHRWFNIAALQANAAAKGWGAKLAHEMPALQVNKARRAARAWMHGARQRSA